MFGCERVPRAAVVLQNRGCGRRTSGKCAKQVRVAKDDAEEISARADREAAATLAASDRGDVSGANLRCEYGAGVPLPYGDGKIFAGLS